MSNQWTISQTFTSGSKISTIYIIVIQIERGSEEEKYCSPIFHCRIWFQRFIHKMVKLISVIYCISFWANLNNNCTLKNFLFLLSSVSKFPSTVLDLLVDLICNADIPTAENTVLKYFLDDAVITTTDSVQGKATEILQIAVNNISLWIRYVKKNCKW